MNLTAPLWLISILFFAERLAKKNWFILAILVIPLIMSVPMLFHGSSDIFKLFLKEIQMDLQARILYEEFGFFLIISVVHSVLCLFVGSCFLLYFFRKNKSIKLIEKITMLLAICSPPVAWYLGFLFKAPFEITPLACSLFGMMTIYMSTKRQFFHVIPSLVWNVFNITKESMVVLNLDGSINTNKAFAERFAYSGDDFWDFAEEISPGLAGYIRQKRDIDCLEVKKDDAFYEVSIKNVLGRKNKFMGQLVTISDVSETKQLTLAKERARIASRLHDNMGNRLIASINNLNLALIQPTMRESRPFIDSAATSNVASLMTLRKIVEGLSPVNFKTKELTGQIKSVINRVSASGIYTGLQVSGDIEKLPVLHKEFIYNTCQEALTNSIIHGKAENTNISLECTACLLELTIIDNGQGCEKIFPNNGLAQMKERAEELGGKIRFTSPSSGGFCIYAEIPIKEAAQ
jgi:signal transduction histidine kinase